MKMRPVGTEFFRAGGHGEDFCRFSQFCENAQKSSFTARVIAKCSFSVTEGGECNHIWAFNVQCGLENLLA